MIRKFLSGRSGNYAILSAILALPLVLGVGLAVDYARYLAMHRHLQDLADAASLTLAASKEQNREKLEKMANDIIAANRNPYRLASVGIASLVATVDDIDLELKGDIPATIMSIAGYDRLPSRASALAERAVRGNVEVALILDNTYSMNGTKLATLKTASANLINELVKTDDGLVRMALVPYADYVNVGMQNRNASWLSVEGDYTVPAVPCTPTGTWITTQKVCVRENPKKTCVTVRDGITEYYECSGGCAEYEDRDITPYEQCTGGKSAQNFKWYGCVTSRPGNGNRLHDDNIGSVKYPGILGTSQKCLNQIVQLTSNKNTLLKAANDMIVNRSGYFPNTYIPAGLIWGLNVLSPDAPFEDAGAYDPRNLRPRKVAVLMTDGENTLRYDVTKGTHELHSSEASKKTELDGTNNDTKAICDYMKTKGIEMFSIAFMVEDATAKSMLEDCATGSSYYYDATDSESLLAAFSDIGASLRVVRLAR